jgi:hypothetical protein
MRDLQPPPVGRRLPLKGTPLMYPKIIGVAALSVLALMGVATSSVSASAKVCSTSGTGAECGGAHGKVFSGAFASRNIGNLSLVFTNSSGETLHTVTCIGSEASGEIAIGSTGTGRITRLSVANCTSSLCGPLLLTAASSSTPWEFTMTTEAAVSNTNGTMDTNVKWAFSCTVLGIPISCSYEAVNAPIKIAGSDSEPILTASNIGLQRVSGNEAWCGTKAHWNSTYKITTPTSLFVL